MKAVSAVYPSVVAGVALMIALLPSLAMAHGGVVEEDDLCVIKIGYLKAHFKIYVPQQRQHTEYCEDIPTVGESVFVMEYQHDGLSEAEIDFRIIQNVTGLGKFARLEDVQAIDNIEAVTLHHEPASVVPDVFTLLHAFDTEGEYIGIVSATRTDTRKTYTAVFPFEVGHTGIGYWPWIIAALLVLQFNYWFMGRRQAHHATTTVLTALCCLMIAVDSFAQDDSSSLPVWRSDSGHFVVSFHSELMPLTINRIHSWVLRVNTDTGDAVVNANITIKGGMPEHEHGLPTEPRIAEKSADGSYRIEGLRFHMNGNWEIRISIDDGTNRDDVTIPLEL